MTTITEQLGRVLSGRYRLDVGLGTGSSAHVYAAYDTRLNRQVAVKLLHPGLARDERFLRRLRAEAQAVAALNHPHVLEVFDWGEEEDGPFLVLEYLGGGSLQDMLDAGHRLDAAQAAAVGAQAARGLAYAHRRGFVHRDVKPANLLFDEDGALRVADFGLARALAEAAWTEPSGAVTGTARYASPELAEGRPLDDRSDVYSLALVLYEAVVGRVPFSADTTLATLLARVGASLPMTPELGPLAPILAQAAISEPLARLSAEELARDLELLSRQLPAAAPLPLTGPSRLDPVERALPEPVTSRHGGAGGTPVPPPGGGATPRLYDGEPEEPVATRATARPPVARAAHRAGAADDGEPAALEAASSAKGRQRRDARRRHRVLPAVLVLLVFVLLGAASVVRFVVYGHSVPRLAGVAFAAAEHDVASEGLRLVVVTHAFSQRPVGTVLVESPRPGTLERAGAEVRVTLSAGRAPVPVPSLAGRTKAAALTALRAGHLGARVAVAYDETVPAGVVVSSAPRAGDVAYGSVVRVVVSEGPAPRTIPTGLDGAPYATASADLTGLRLVPVEVHAYSDAVPSGDVVATVPPGGTPGIAVGTSVRVVVSLGPRTVQVPSVKDLSIDAAIALLQGAGLPVTEQVGPPGSTYATTTDPLPGATVRPGTDVTLYVG
ncbi:MAG: Stk1 family PASTA domain-containing Ser/Thr kinase [Acidimicrobiales bacterium]